MQRGCMQRNSRKEGPDAWQFRWSETRLDGKRLYRKKIVGTVEQYPDEGAAPKSTSTKLSTRTSRVSGPKTVLLHEAVARNSFRLRRIWV